MMSGDSTLRPSLDRSTDDLAGEIASVLSEQEGDDAIAALADREESTGETLGGLEGRGPSADDGAGTSEDGGAGGNDDPEAAALPPAARELLKRRREELDSHLESVQRDAEPGRQTVEAFSAVVALYRNYMNSLGVTPMQAMQTLLGAEYQLRNGSPEQKAAMFSKIAKDSRRAVT